MAPRPGRVVHRGRRVWRCSACRRPTTTTRCAPSGRRSRWWSGHRSWGASWGSRRRWRCTSASTRPGRGRDRHRSRHRDRRGSEHRRAVAAGGRTRRGARGFDHASAGEGRGRVRRDAHRSPPRSSIGEIAAWPVVRLAPRSTRSHDPVRRPPSRARAVERHVRARAGAPAARTWSRCSVSPGSARPAWSRSSGTRLGDDVTVLSGRPSQFEEQVTFWPLGQMIRERGRRRRAPPDRGARRPAPAGGGRVGRSGGCRQGRAPAGAGARSGRGREPREPLPQRRDPPRACSRCSKGSPGAGPSCWCSRTCTRRSRCCST